MANAVKWSALGTLTSYLTTELNSLANNDTKLGAAINNDTDRNRYMAVELALAAQGSARFNKWSDTNIPTTIPIWVAAEGAITYESEAAPNVMPRMQFDG
jgi:hypothetical protein